MRVLFVVAMQFAMLALAGCGESDEATTAPVGGMTGSPTVADVATATIPAETATSSDDASPQAIFTTRYFLQASADAEQPLSAELVTAASDIVKARLEAFLQTGVRISPDPAFPDLIVADVPVSRLTQPEMETVLALMTETGLMEIIDTQGSALPVDTVVSTTLGASDAGGPAYETIVSGLDVSRADVTTDQFGIQVVGFELGDEGAARFEAHTRDNIGQPMSIVMDKRVVNTATIMDTISGEGVISGLPADEAVKVAMQLNSDPLPVALSFTNDPGTPPLRALPTIPATPTLETVVGTPFPTVEPVSELQLRVEPRRGATLDDALLDTVINRLERRLDTLHEDEATITQTSADTLVIDVEDMTDDVAWQLGALLTTPALVEIVDAAGELLHVGTLAATSVGGDLGTEESFIGPVRETIVYGDDIVNAEMPRDPSGTASLDLYLSDTALARLEEHARNHPGAAMALTVDNMIVHVATVEEMLSVPIVVTGLPEEAVRDLVIMLKAGWMPATVSVVN